MKDKSELLLEWLGRVRQSQRAHYESFKVLSFLHYAVGILLIIITATLGVSNYKNTNGILGGHFPQTLLYFLSSTLAGIQTFLKFSERMEKHKTAGSNFGSLRRDIEEALATGMIKDEKIELIKIKLDTLASGSPNILSIIWNRSQRLSAKPS